MVRPETNPDLKKLFASHPRTWRENFYVYPVISRRSGGLSIGINLNPGKTCNFGCIYCQVDRNTPPAVRSVDPDRLRLELESTVRSAVSGSLFSTPPFDCVPEGQRELKDIAFSGDGEPTTSPHLKTAIEMVVAIRQALRLETARTVLITNAAYLDRPAVQEALRVLDRSHGEVWAKLDAGTEEYYQKVNRPNVPLRRVLDNIGQTARVRPVVIQSLWMSTHGEIPPMTEIDAFGGHLRDILDTGGRIRLVQVYTVARQTREPFVTPLNISHLDMIAERVRELTNLPVDTFGSF